MVLGYSLPAYRSKMRIVESIQLVATRVDLTLNETSTMPIALPECDLIGSFLKPVRSLVLSRGWCTTDGGSRRDILLR